MKKQFVKTVMATVLFVGVSFSALLPKTMGESVVKQSLGPDGFKTTISSMKANQLVIDSYAQTILNQPNIDLKGITSVGDMQASVNQHQQIARENATYWLNTMKPNLNEANTSVSSYNDVFQGHYNALVEAADKQDPMKLKIELEQLMTSISNNEQQVATLLTKLISFRDKMAVDTANFKGDSDRISAVLAGTDSGIPAIQKQITGLNATIKQANDNIIIGASLCALGLPCIAGGPMIAKAKSTISNSQNQINQLMQQISKMQSEAAVLTNVKNQTTNLTTTIDTAITALQNVSNQWHTIGAKYTSVKNNVAVITPDDFLFIKEDLKSAKDSWQDLKTYVDGLQK